MYPGPELSIQTIHRRKTRAVVKGSDMIVLSGRFTLFTRIKR